MRASRRLPARPAGVRRFCKAPPPKSEGGGGGGGGVVAVVGLGAVGFVGYRSMDPTVKREIDAWRGQKGGSFSRVAKSVAYQQLDPLPSQTSDAAKAPPKAAVPEPTPEPTPAPPPPEPTPEPTPAA